jgi:hypothetical protein
MKTTRSILELNNEPKNGKETPKEETTVVRAV